MHKYGGLPDHKFDSYIPAFWDDDDIISIYVHIADDAFPEKYDENPYTVQMLDKGDADQYMCSEAYLHFGSNFSDKQIHSNSHIFMQCPKGPLKLFHVQKDKHNSEISFPRDLRLPGIGETILTLHGASRRFPTLPLSNADLWEKVKTRVTYIPGLRPIIHEFNIELRDTVDLCPLLPACADKTGVVNWTVTFHTAPVHKDQDCQTPRDEVVVPSSADRLDKIGFLKEGMIIEVQENYDDLQKQYAASARHEMLDIFQIAKIWMADTGCGKDLLGRKMAEPFSDYFINVIPIKFSTANGASISKLALPTSI